MSGFKTIEGDVSLLDGDEWAGRVKVGDGTDFAGVETDAETGQKRLLVAGRLSLTKPTEPPGTTAVEVFADSPENVNNDHDTEYVIPDGKTFVLQQVVVGGEGDPQETGSVARIIFDANGTEKLITKIYVSGFTNPFAFPDRSTARDGTSLDGNAGGTNKIIIRRDRLGGGALEIDVEMYGYLKDT